MEKSEALKKKNKGGHGKSRFDARYREKWKELAEKELPTHERIKILASLAKGVRVRDQESGLVYETKPDLKALQELEERMQGKSMSIIDTESNTPVSYAFIVIPKQGITPSGEKRG